MYDVNLMFQSSVLRASSEDDDGCSDDFLYCGFALPNEQGINVKEA